MLKPTQDKGQLGWRHLCLKAHQVGYLLVCAQDFLEMSLQCFVERSQVAVAEMNPVKATCQFTVPSSLALKKRLAFHAVKSITLPKQINPLFPKANKCDWNKGGKWFAQGCTCVFYFSVGYSYFAIKFCALVVVSSGSLSLIAGISVLHFTWNLFTWKPFLLRSKH